MTNDELLQATQENMAAAAEGVKLILRVGLVQPVPPALLTNVLVHLRNAACAMTELERRARGGAPVKAEK